MTATNGYELSAGNEVEVNFKEAGGSVLASSIYVDTAANGDKVCWVVILEG